MPRTAADRTTARLALAAQIACAVGLVLTITQPFPAAGGVVLTSVVLLACVLAMLAAALRLAVAERGPRRAVFLGMAGAALFGLVSRVLTLALLPDGGPSGFLSSPNVVFVFGGHLPLVAGFGVALAGRARVMRSELLVDTLLLVGAAAVVLALLPGGTFPAELHTPLERGIYVFWRSIVAVELFLVALLVAWRGDALGVRTGVGVALGTVAFAVTNALQSQAALVPGVGAAATNDALWILVVLAFAFALQPRAERAAPPQDLSHTGEMARFGGEVATLRAVTIIASILLTSLGALVLGFGRERRAGLALALAGFGVLLALRAAHALWVQRREARTLGSRVVEGRALASTLEHRVAERTAELAEAQRVLQRMWTLGQQVTSELHPARVIQRFMEAVVDVAQADGALLALLGEPEATHARVAAAVGTARALVGHEVPLDGSAVGRVVRSGEPWCHDDAHGEPLALHAPTTALVTGGAPRAVAVVPLMRRGERIGAVSVLSSRPRRFSAEEIARLAALTDMLSVALANAELVENLRQAEWRFRTLFRAAPDAVLAVDAQGRVREANDCVRDVTGLDPSSVIGRPVTTLVAPEDRPRLERVIVAALRGRTERLEARFEYADPAAGAPRTHVVALAASRVPEADPPTVLLVGRDVTAEREMRARLLDAERLAAIGELVAGVAHEVNNPLGSISAYAQLILRTPELAEPHREAAEVIRSEATRAGQVVKDLLAFARRGDDGTPRREAVDLTQVVERSLRLRGYQLRAAGVTVDRDLAAELPPVLGDARQLQQVVLNLVTNSIQAMAPEGGGVLRVTTRVEGEAVTLTVADTGPGIPAAAQPRVFEPFFTTKAEGEGTGLGLSVSYGIVAAHGGSLTLAETSVEGTSFVVALPMASESALASDGEAELPHAPALPPPLALPPAASLAAALAAPLAPAPGLGTLPARSPLAGLRVLVVDDEPSLRRSLEAFGRMRGFTVVSAEGGEAALELLERMRVDAVVCDLRMPGMDGLAFHELLGRERPGLAARTVFVTGDIVTEMGTRMGPNGRKQSLRQPTLTKPFSFERLEETVLAVLRA